MKLDFSKVHDIEIGDIDTSDYPDFCNAYIASATIELSDGTYRDATDEELDIINDDSDFVYSHVLNYFF